MATLLGIAIDQGYIDAVKQPIADFFRDDTFQHPDPGKDRMTLEDLLTMRTGLDWQEQDATFRQLYQSDDWVRFVLDLLFARGDVGWATHRVGGVGQGRDRITHRNG